jgi:hypothetical protein
MAGAVSDTRMPPRVSLGEARETQDSGSSGTTGYIAILLGLFRGI